jgi:glycosyltransferase A (GT-A) superfamily protein (DUF2064 family)
MHSEARLNTAVLYFTLSPEAEARKKRFTSVHNFHTNVTVAELLRDHTGRQIERSGLPFFLFDEQNQTGETFGEKIVHAFKDVFDKGYDNVIAVGSDTPQLKSRHLTEASEVLANDSASIVLGPSVDGGSWLMGFTRDAFSPESFVSLPWNSSNLLSSILEQCEPGQNIHTLECFRDVDHADDLQNFLNIRDTNRSIKRLRQDICRILELADTYAGKTDCSPNTLYHHFSFLLRGPPTTSDITLLIK